jgi:hypothetical protein
MKAYHMSLISAESISLDSTFKETKKDRNQATLRVTKIIWLQDSHEEVTRNPEEATRNPEVAERLRGEKPSNKGTMCAIILTGPRAASGILRDPAVPVGTMGSIPMCATLKRLLPQTMFQERAGHRPLASA